MTDIDQLVREACTQENVDARRVFQMREEFLVLCRFLDSFKPVNILEIGCLGHTFNIFCQLSTGKKIGVDIVDHSANVTQTPSIFICGDSTVVYEDVKRICISFDFIFIDGAHDLAGVTKDFNLYKTLLSPRGFIAFHDMDPDHAFYDVEVKQFWAELNEGHKLSIVSQRSPGHPLFLGHELHYGGIGLWWPE